MHLKEKIFPVLLLHYYCCGRHSGDHLLSGVTTLECSSLSLQAAWVIDNVAPLERAPKHRVSVTVVLK
jgi:hypothetical protein